MKTISVKTLQRTQFIDITRQVEEAIAREDVEEGLCYLYVPHTTAGLTINENADPAVAQDMLASLNKLIPFEDNYRHMEGNSAAHIKASLVGLALYIIIKGKKLVLGTWQGIYFCEFDGPRNRKVYLKTVSGG